MIEIVYVDKDFFKKICFVYIRGILVFFNFEMLLYYNSLFIYLFVDV